MIFAIYRGFEDGDDGQGSFTKGRLYVAAAEVDDSVVVDIRKLKVKDDNSETVWIEPENDRFEYPEEVFGVIVKSLGTRMPGEVVIIDGADDEGEFLSIVGMGYVRTANIQLLDSVMVKPGMMVYERKATRWRRISRVDECIRVRVEGSDEMRDCTDFVFAVSDGDLATVPLLRCLDSTGRDNIEEGKIYRVRGLDDAGMLLVEDDDGKESSFEPTRFEFV